MQDENKPQSVPVPRKIPVPRKVPVPKANSSDSIKIGIMRIGIVCLLLILLLLLFLLLNVNTLRQAETSGQQTAGTEATDNDNEDENDNVTHGNQEQKTDQNSTEKNDSNQQATEQATSIKEKTQTQNRTETDHSNTEIQDQGHKESSTEKKSEDKSSIDSSEKIVQSEETTDVPRQDESIAPWLQSKHSENRDSDYSNDFHQGDATVKIFGTTGKGSKFVFVFDHSGSMAGSPLEAAKKELIQCLTSLKNHHKFNIIFYDDQQLIWKPNDQLISAIKQNKKDAEKFITNIASAGGTEPLPPLLTAIDYKPDVIFFLTDGEFTLDLDNICSKTKKIHINVIQFGSGDNQSALLQELAKRTHGDYKYIDVKKLDAL
jgi:Mg-chelatase subunit ChlD